MKIKAAILAAIASLMLATNIQATQYFVTRISMYQLLVSDDEG
jgi:hypothetical protein